MDDSSEQVTFENDLKNTTYATQNNYLVEREIQPMMGYYYENEGYMNQQNCIMFSTISYPYVQSYDVSSQDDLQKIENCFYYQLCNNVQGYRLLPSKNQPYFQNMHLNQVYHQLNETTNEANYQPKPNSNFVERDTSQQFQRKKFNRQRLSNKMHPVQLLHQIFRKEAFVMEYERLNDGPFSHVRVTYKVNGHAYVSEATRLKEARRLCAKKVLRDQFPDLQIEQDNDIPEPQYDITQFDNKHPVQILYQIFRYESMEMHCEEEGAAHFAKHIFTFIIKGKKYQAKAETIKEAKRRAAILALNDYLK